MVHSQPKSATSQSKVNWTKVAKMIALVGGVIGVAYSLFLLKGRLTSTSSKLDASSCFSNQKAAIEFLDGTVCCAGDPKCNGSGEGTFKWPNGQSYSGKLENGAFVGKGIYSPYQGLAYQGGLKDGHFSGYGEYTSSSNGRSYKGSFLNGASHGQGTHTSPDGTYKGEFNQNQFHGLATYTWSDKNSYTGVFTHGVAICPDPSCKQYKIDLSSENIATLAKRRNFHAG